MEKELIVKALENYCPAGNYDAPPLKIRKAKLRDFRKHLIKAKDEIYAALVADLNRDQLDTLLAEIIPLLDITRFLEKKLAKLLRPRRLAGSMTTFPASAKLYREPFGRVLVVSTWNYPLLLTLEPAIGAYAAGNRVILKLSPRSPYTNAVVVKLLKSCFSRDEIMVIDQELSLDETISFRYDYIFLTGNTSTGRKVMLKAAENLTPCTMELGGKNPCVITADADLRLAARRIVWGKFFNAGQSCAAPDYLLVQKDVKPELMNLICKEVRRMYGENPLDSGKFTSMPDAETYQRILDLISDGRLICGGNHNPKMLSVEPTVIDRLPDDSPLFTGEVFGPVLPVREFSTEDELMVNLNRLPRPLAAYCFGGSKKLRDFFRCRYSAGAVIFNDVMLHFCNMNIPFGGVGASGFGAYHGEKTLTTFTHEKPVMKQSSWFDLPFRYPPHRQLIRRLMEIFNRMG